MLKELNFYVKIILKKNVFSLWIKKLFLKF